MASACARGEAAVPHYGLPHLHRLAAAKGALQEAEVRDSGETWQSIFAPRSCDVRVDA
jgi:hypothetical protein